MTSLYRSSDINLQLEEMVRVLLPRYKFYMNHQYIHIGKAFPGEKIHWFEFVTTTLFDAVMKNFVLKYQEEHRNMMFKGIQAILNGCENEDQEHPINYLYKVYKKHK